jgi:phosphoenolpyruvate-protein kinase (PTS system EI component)
VLTADHIAAACDFISVGTNDLIQYAFAADRQNEEMTYLYRPLHPSILRALQQVFAAAAAKSCSVSVCGDMAGDPAHAWALLGLGLRSFSMTAREIPFVKSVLLKTELALAEQFVREALLLTDPEDVEALVTARLGERFSLELEGRMGRRPSQLATS